MTPSKAVFDGIYVLCETLGTTTDYVDETSGVGELPYIYIGEGSLDEWAVEGLAGNVSQTIHIYGNRVQRFEVDKLSTKIRDGLKRGIEEFGGYRLTNPKVRTTILNDNSMGQPLIHYALDYNVTFNK